MKRLHRPKEIISNTQRLKQILERGFFQGDGWQRKGKTIRMWPSITENDEDFELIYDILAEELDRRSEI